MATLSATQVAKICEHAARVGLEEKTGVSVAAVLREWEEFDAPDEGISAWLLVGVWRQSVVDWFEANGVATSQAARLDRDLLDRLCLGVVSDDDEARALELAHAAE